MASWFIRLVAGLMLPVLCLACSRGRPAGAWEGPLELSERLTQLDGGESRLLRMPVSRGGVRRESLVLTGPVRAAATLPQAAGAVWLECLAAPVFNAGDGFDLEILLRTSGGETTVVKRRFDPGRKAEDRRWAALGVTLRLEGAEDARLELRLAPGARGDLVADWLALADLRIRRQVPPP